MKTGALVGDYKVKRHCFRCNSVLNVQAKFSHYSGSGNKLYTLTWTCPNYHWLQLFLGGVHQKFTAGYDDSTVGMIHDHFTEPQLKAAGIEVQE